jgi:ABC-2 type transport system permease protein
MRTILFIIQKEFKQIFRNKSMLPIIFVVPIVQLIVLVNAATLEMKNINLWVVDTDQSTTSRELTGKFTYSPFFKLQGSGFSIDEAEKALALNQTDVILRIPSGFERTLKREGTVKVQLLINAINGTVAGISNAYASSIILGYNRQILLEQLPVAAGVKQININHSYWYNPELNYKTFMVPGVLTLLVTIIGMFLSGMNLVREKEMGTIEQINVTPIKKYQFIIGKLVPFWIIALFELAFGLTIGKLLFDIPMIGSLALLFFAASVYLVLVLALGLLLSTLANTQQQAMFVAFFFMIVFVMMSGVFTSVDTMPKWGQNLNLINPVFYFMNVIRMILLKGSGFMDILKDLISMAVYAYLVLSLAIWRYRKTV